VQVVGYVAIGFPLGGMANLVLRSRAHWSELELSPIPKLVLQGTRDSYSPLSTLRDLVAQYNAYEPQPGPLELWVCQQRGCIQGPTSQFYKGGSNDV
jgi:hypothetical protein